MIVVRSKAVLLLLFIHNCCSHRLWGYDVRFLLCYVVLDVLSSLFVMKKKSWLLYFDRPFDFLFDLILYVHSTIFQLCGTILPGLNQY